MGIRFLRPKYIRRKRSKLQGGSQKRLCGKRRNTSVDPKILVFKGLNLPGEFSQVLYWLLSMSSTTQGCCVDQKV